MVFFSKEKWKLRKSCCSKRKKATWENHRARLWEIQFPLFTSPGVTLIQCHIIIHLWTALGICSTTFHWTSLGLMSHSHWLTTPQTRPKKKCFFFTLGSLLAGKSELGTSEVTFSIVVKYKSSHSLPLTVLRHCHVGPEGSHSVPFSFDLEEILWITLSFMN